MTRNFGPAKSMGRPRDHLWGNVLCLAVLECGCALFSFGFGIWAGVRLVFWPYVAVLSRCYSYWLPDVQGGLRVLGVMTVDNYVHICAFHVWAILM